MAPHELKTYGVRGRIVATKFEADQGINEECYRWLRTLTEDEAFKECNDISDRADGEQYDMELAVRFLVFRQQKILK